MIIINIHFYCIYCNISSLLLLLLLLLLLRYHHHLIPISLPSSLHARPARAAMPTSARSAAAHKALPNQNNNGPNLQIILKGITRAPGAVVEGDGEETLSSLSSVSVPGPDGLIQHLLDGEETRGSCLLCLCRVQKPILQRVPVLQRVELDMPSRGEAVSDAPPHLAPSRRRRRRRGHVGAWSDTKRQLGPVSDHVGGPTPSMAQ